MKNHIVIIGGMGPQASAHLHSLIVNNVGKNKAPNEFPYILHASIPSPDFIATPEAADEAVDIIQDLCRSVPVKSAAAIGIACNTAHLLLDRLPDLPRQHFVSMIEAVADDIASAGYKTVGLLASPFTIQSRLYHNALEKRGVVVVQPNRTGINQLNSIIHDVIGNTPPKVLRDKLTNVAQTLEEQGVDCILLGCTELPLVGIRSKLPTIDSLSSLSKAMLAHHAMTK